MPGLLKIGPSLSRNVNNILWCSILKQMRQFVSYSVSFSAYFFTQIEKIKNVLKFVIFLCKRN
jgi:hypothetical protein